MRLRSSIGFVVSAALSCHRRRRKEKARGLNLVSISSPSGWRTAVHLKGPATMAVVDGSLRVCHLMAHNGRADTPPSCPLLGLKQPRFCSGPESAFDLGCVKTPKSNLRIEISSRLRQFKEQQR